MGRTKRGLPRVAAVVAAAWIGGSAASLAAEGGGAAEPFHSPSVPASAAAGPESGGASTPGSPAEFAARLEAQGVPPERIQEMLAQMSAAGGAAPSEAADPNASASPSAVPLDRVGQAPPVVSVDSSGVPGALVPFGYALFQTSPSTYRQPAVGPVDPDYPLGPGDQIVLDVWGDTVFRIERELDREGGVNLPDVGRVVLAGLTLDETRHALRRRLSAVYSGLSENETRATTHLSVTLGNLRVVRAFVVGRAQRPGGYDLSAASTVFHALFFAGGPTDRGSMRDIRLVRGGKEIATFDVYEYLRSGTRSGDVRLENDDTIFVPPAGARVSVQGQVREPGIYELLPGETLAKLVDMAGGFTERAFPGRIQVDRILPYEQQIATREDRRVLDYSFEGEGKDAQLQDGDVVTVFEIADRVRNFVTLRGEVRRPGTYELSAQETLADVIDRAGGLLETAFLDRAEVVRTYDDKRREQIAVDLRRLDTADVSLLPRDEITVHSIWALRDPERVSVYGAVRHPGPFELRENMTLRDLLLQAGGLQKYAYRKEVEVSRVRLSESTGDHRTAEIFQVPLGENYLTSSEGDFRLMPYDNVFVREEPSYELQRNVTVTGEVRFPGVYTMTHPRERLSSVVARTGGLKDTAFPDGFTISREREGVGRIALDLRRALKEPDSNDNIVLFAGDSLHVPEEPKTVAVKGEVGYPASLVHVPGWSIGDYVAMAGGTNEEADEGRIRVIYSTGAASRVKRFWFDPEVRPGSTIVVPKKPEREGVNWGNVVRDTTSILASLATVYLVVDKTGG